MRIIDPCAFFGIDSGLRRLTVTKSERATLLRAVDILERGHDLIDAVDPDHQGSHEIGDALCLAPGALRELATDGISL